MFELRQTAIFRSWLADLRDTQARLRIAARLRRAQLGNLGDVKSVGDGVQEMRLDHGPGYRLYFTRCAAATRALRIGISAAPKSSPGRSDMPLETSRFDIQNHLATTEEQSAYLEAALASDDPSFIAVALGDIARARGVTEFAREAGLSRDTIYKRFRAGR